MKRNIRDVTDDVKFFLLADKTIFGERMHDFLFLLSRKKKFDRF